MSARRITHVVAAIFLAVLFAYGDDKSAAGPKPMTSQTRMDVIRSLNAELVYARHAFPAGDKGLTLKDGAVSPSGQQLEMLIATHGQAVKPGDPARITAVQFIKDSLVLEINGGPKKKPKWYQRIQVGGMGGMTPVAPPPDNNPNLHGSFVRLAFDKYVPEMSVDQLKQLLKPVLNFDAKSAVDAYMDTVPPKVKDAIKNHQVLVGMNREMVTYAKGRAPKKIRERDGTTEYEEWIYGEPPQEVEFVRFVGDEVVRLEIMKVSGEKIVRTEKEVDLTPKPALASAEGQDQQQPASGSTPAKRPSLRRPGEPAPTPPPGSGQTQGQTPLPPTQGPPTSPPPQ